MGKFREFYTTFTESPDVTVGEEGQAVSFVDDPEALTFLIDKADGSFIYAKTNSTYESVTQRGVSEEKFRFTHTTLFEWIFSGQTKRMVEEIDVEVVNNLSEKAIQKIYEEAKDNYDVRTVSGKFIGGRLFKGHDVIAFWNSLDDVKEFRSIIRDFVEDQNLDPDEIAYDTLDAETLVPSDKIYSSLDEDDEEIERLSPEEVKELMAIQHLDPEAKKKLRQNVEMEDDAPKSKLPFGWNVFSRMSESVKAK